MWSECLTARNVSLGSVDMNMEQDQNQQINTAPNVISGDATGSRVNHSHSCLAIGSYSPPTFTTMFPPEQSWFLPSDQGHKQSGTHDKQRRSYRRSTAAQLHRVLCSSMKISTHGGDAALCAQHRQSSLPQVSPNSQRPYDFCASVSGRYFLLMTLTFLYTGFLACIIS